MVNSWTTKEEAIQELKRLCIIKASAVYELDAFRFGFPIELNLSELENEIHTSEIGIKEIEKKFNISIKDITI